MKTMIMIRKTKLFALLLSAILASCSLSPGMHMSTNSDFGSSNNYVFIESLNKRVEVENINESISSDKASDTTYRIGNGDQISITVWGLPEIFPLSSISPDLNLRRVDSNGDIYFPYAGIIKAAGKSQNDLREDLRIKLSEYFTDPQLDISIARFNSQKVYLLGEVTRPQKINITDIPLSLADALGEVQGLNTNTSSGAEVFIIRNNDVNGARIFRADLSSPAGFVEAGNFYLKDNDIVYVNAKSTTRWNRVISQFFPFSSFLNSVDNLLEN